MADHCCFCDTRRPAGGTNHLVLNGGQVWLEFCPPCGERETLHNPEIGTVTVAELFRSLEEGRAPRPISPQEEAEEIDGDSFGSIAHLFA